MNIVHLHKGPDTSGQSMAGKAVLEAAGHSVRVFVGRQHPFGYPEAERWDDAAVREAYAWADTVVLHNYPSLFEKVDDGSPKRIVVHHHGSRFRGHPDYLYDQAVAIGALQIVSTVDLLLSVPRGGHAEWFPQVVDIERMAAIRRRFYRPDGRLRVAHAPTNRGIKGTRFYIRHKRDMRRQADFLLIERQPWTRCLELKAAADVFVDQLLLGYGNNAIEAWAMGMPVLSGASPAILARMRQEYGGSLPFYETSSQRLGIDIGVLLDDPDIRAEYARRGMEHVERYHAPDAWLARAEQVYGDRPAAAAA